MRKRRASGARAIVAEIATPAAGSLEPQPDLAPPVAGGCAAGVQWRAARAGSPGTGRGERGVRISNVTAYQLPGTRYPWVFLRLETDTGLTGLGQVSSGPNAPAVAAAASQLGRLLVGEDPAGSSTSGTSSTASFNSLGSLGFASALISGVDIALWDLRGKALGLPVFELLGGRFRDRLVLYSNGWFAGCTHPGGVRAPRRRTVDEGHTALKLDPFHQHPADFAKYAAGYDPADDAAAVAASWRPSGRASAPA